jgi:TPR repeat protein
MYAAGRGVSQNDQEAIKWYSLAAEQGNQTAKERLAALDQQAQLASQQQVAQMQSYETRCAAFGFTNDTPEMANCKFELYKLENTTSATSANGSAAPSSTQISREIDSLQILNQSLQMMNDSLNGIRPTAPVQNSVSCTRIGDFSRQVFAFNGIACPFGYAPSY